MLHRKPLHVQFATLQAHQGQVRVISPNLPTRLLNLQGTKISHLRKRKLIFKHILGDMLVPRMVEGTHGLSFYPPPLSGVTLAARLLDI